MKEMRETGRSGSFGCPIPQEGAAGASAMNGYGEGGAPGRKDALPGACFLGRGSRGLLAALAPFIGRESLSCRELRLLTDLILFGSGPFTGADGEAVPELDLFEDTAELWLFGSGADTGLRFSWRIEPEPEAAGMPLPEDDLERCLTLRAYLLSCPKDPAGDALLRDCEARIKKLTRGRARAKRAKSRLAG